MTSNLTKLNVLSLYRTMLKDASKFQHYNYRSHALRRVKSSFRENKNMKPEEALEAYKFGLQQSGVLSRQSIISRMYPSERSVMEHSV